MTCRVKFPDESGESEIHIGFYSAESTDKLQNVIETIDSQFNTKSDSVDKNENRIRLIWKVNLNDTSTIEKALEAINPIIFDFTSLALQVLFGGKAAITSAAIISKNENTIESATPTETMNNDPPENHIETYTWDDGDVYEGYWKGEYPHGKGKMTYANGDVYVGEWNDGEKHGIGKMTYANGDFYEGGWQNDFEHGKGKKNYGEDNLEGADTYEGEWENGWRHGQGKITYKHQALFNFRRYSDYEGEWKDDNHHFGKMTYVDGDVYEGSWSLLGHDGNGKMTYVDGDVYEGEWEDGEKHGRGTMTYACGQKYQGEFLNGKSHGYGEHTWPNGKWKRGTWENDEFISGKVKLIFDSGDVYEGEWENGTYHGEGIYVWSSGKIYEGEWKGGEIHGRGKMTYVDGDVYEGEWENGKRHGRGEIKYVNKDWYNGDWHNDMRHGKAISIINGEAITLWENDKPKIKWDTYKWDNGNYYEGYCKGNYPHGEGKKTFADGAWRKGEFEEGVFISGEGKIIYESGDYYEGELKGNQRHGYGEYHFKTGGVWSGNYYEDLMHGRIWYDSDGDGDGLGYYAEYVYDERKYKEGSVVQLKSGGPKMTVTDVLKKKITCNWLNRGKPYSEEFDEDMLKLIE